MADAPSEKEERYFWQKEIERLQKLREEHLTHMAKAEREKLKELHYLRCAKCGQKMETEMLGGVEIEICPDCRGIYLDDGELGKLLKESNRAPFLETLKFIRGLWKD